MFVAVEKNRDFFIPVDYVENPSTLYVEIVN